MHGLGHLHGCLRHALGVIAPHVVIVGDDVKVCALQGWRIIADVPLTRTHGVGRGHIAQLGHVVAVLFAFANEHGPAVLDRLQHFRQPVQHQPRAVLRPLVAAGVGRVGLPQAERLVAVRSLVAAGFKQHLAAFVRVLVGADKLAARLLCSAGLGRWLCGGCLAVLRAAGLLLFMEQVAHLQPHGGNDGFNVAACLTFQHDALFAVPHAQAGVFIIVRGAPAHILALAVRAAVHAKARKKIAYIHAPAPLTVFFRLFFHPLFNGSAHVFHAEKVRFAGLDVGKPPVAHSPADGRDGQPGFLAHHVDLYALWFGR